jgi:2-polyprenyl-3-methyl-5-hydroxy-6-metoxy-1,4-benzoquinol methylase
LNIIQDFYNNLASQYDKLFFDWESATKEQATILNKLFTDNGFDKTANILDCACGIGTQAIGLALLGYNITASDISEGEIAQAKVRAEKATVKINFTNADFRCLSNTFSDQFDIIIAMDNALPHMLSATELEKAINSIVNKLKENG